MTMTPIHKIPMNDTEMTLSALVNSELTAIPAQNLYWELTSLVEHDAKEESLSITLDWAMQIREECGISWGEAIRAASILFYG